MSDQTIAVTVTPVPGSPKAVVLTEGASVADALEAAGLSASGYSIRVDGDAATTDTEVGNGSRVYLTRQLKGN